MVKDFRPISLIGSMYKIITKILANRLVLVLGDLVNEVQSAFIADRQILDGPFILNEIVQWCQSKKKQSLVFKVDFKKAFDSSCLRSSRGSVIVNGSPTEEFQFHKGLKQGDPLSPFFPCVLRRTNVIFMGQWNESNLDTIVQVLECFHRASGLRLNMSKIPMKILQCMESIRSHFFNGYDPLAKKPTLVKWTNVLASKEKDGLGISRLYALNRAFMFTMGLLRSFLKTLHYGRTSSNLFMEIMEKLVNRILCFGKKLMGCCGLNFCFQELTHGILQNINVAVMCFTQFLFSKQFGFSLSVETVRGGVEQDQFDSLKAMVEGTSLANIRDRWIWSLQVQEIHRRLIRKLIVGFTS
ncbi:RNA-directed DNA polymerase, eukaryota, reverse transcriptase zinc-binding domain protein [Tanacetum coccineum]